MKKISLTILILFILISCGKKKDIILTGSDISNSLDNREKLVLKAKFDTSDSTINYYNKNDITLDNTSYKEDDTPFTIVDYGPIDQLPAQVKKPTIYVVFSQPVVPIAKLGDVIRKTDLMTISPEVSGVFRWYGTRMLSFEPDDTYMPEKKYTVTVSENIKSLGGKSLQEENSFEFYTELLHIEYSEPSNNAEDVPFDQAKEIKLTFSYPVELSHINQYIEVTSDSKKLSHSISRIEKNENIDDDYYKKTVLLKLNASLQENTNIKVILKKGASSKPDNLGINQDITINFRTLNPFKFNSSDTYSWSFPRSEKGDSNPIYLRFSHPVDKESVNDAIGVSLDIENINDYIEVYNDIIRLSNLPVTYNSSYEITISDRIKDIYGRNLSKELTETVHIPNASSLAYLPNRGTKILEAEFDPKIIFEHQNIFKGSWAIASIDDPYNQNISQMMKPYDFSYAKQNVKHYKIVDLKPYLNKSGKGFVGISLDFERENSKWNFTEELKVQVTDLAVTTRYAYNKMIVMVTSLSSGKAVENATVKIGNGDKIISEQVTDEKGIVNFDFDGEYNALFKNASSSSPVIYVTKDDDKLHFEPNYSHNTYSSGIYNTIQPLYAEKPKVQTFIFTDRGLYKPGEEVTYRGIDRIQTKGTYSSYRGKFEIKAKSNKWKAEPFYETTGTTTSSGGFHGSFKLSDTIEPGYYRIEYSHDDEKRYADFQVANFRRLSFQVKMNKPDLIYTAGDNLSSTLNASYLSGGNMGGADYEYFWTKNSTYFRPQDTKWSQYRFGPGKYVGQTTMDSGNGKLDMSGNANISIKTDRNSDYAGVTWLYKCVTRVEDIDRQVIGSQASFTVHPAAFYIGTKFQSSDKGYWSTFVKKGESVKVDYALVTPDGEEFYSSESIAPLAYKLVRREWKIAQQKGVYGRINSRYEVVETVESTGEIKNSGSNGTFSIKPENSGSYHLLVTGEDNQGRQTETKFYFYATGSEWIRWGGQNADQIELVADKDIYEPGETARLLIKSPLKEGKYMLTIEREGLIDERVIELKGSANVIEIPVKDDYTPVFYVAISSYSKRTEAPSDSYYKPDLGKPKGYFGITTVKVSTDIMKIDLEITQDKPNYEPGDKASYTIKASKDGKPLKDTEITFMVVDRGVLDLINYHVPDPVSFFYSTDKFPLGVKGADSRSLLIDPVTYEMKDLQGGDAFKESLAKESEERNNAKKLDERKDFRPLAFFEPYILTDENGAANVAFTLPDNLTTYRCTAIAVKNNLFGKSESETLVNNPINVRTALNRRLRVRDTSVAGVILNNLSNKEYEITISVESDLLKIEGESKKTIKLAGNSILEVPFKLLAMRQGEAEISFTIKSEILNEKLTKKLTIEQPYIKEAFSTIGQAQNNIANEGVIIPSYVAKGFGGIDINISSSRLSTLGASIEYLFDYPHGCFEQRSSMIFPLIIFPDLSKKFITNINIKKIVNEELEFWGNNQNSDGGFSYWSISNVSSLYVSIKIAKVLWFAKHNNFRIPNNIDIDKLLDYISKFDQYTHDYEMAYSFYVQSLWKRETGMLAREFYDEKKDTFDTGTYSLMGLTFDLINDNKRSKECFTLLKNHIKVGTQSIDITHPADYNRYYFNNDISQMAKMLMLYNKHDSNSDMGSRIVNTLINDQKGGYWTNTYTTEWVLQAFYDIFKDEKVSETDYTADVTLADTDLFKTEIKGFDKTQYNENFAFEEPPIVDMQRDKLLPLEIKQTGEGKLYYTVTMRYALPMEIAPARDEGFSIHTEIYTLDGEEISYDKLELGETYKMKGYISTSKTRYFVAARLPVPSGAEILDSSFVTTASYDDFNDDNQNNNNYSDFDYYNYYRWGSGTPVEKIYDNEVRFFFNYFKAGNKEVEFTFRVTTPGIYPTPPALVECMYEEEVFGRNEGKLYIINQ